MEECASQRQGQDATIQNVQLASIAMLAAAAAKLLNLLKLSVKIVCQTKLQDSAGLMETIKTLA